MTLDPAAYYEVTLDDTGDPVIRGPIGPNDDPILDPDRFRLGVGYVPAVYTRGDKVKAMIATLQHERDDDDGLEYDEPTAIWS